MMVVFKSARRAGLLSLTRPENAGAEVRSREASVHIMAQGKKLKQRLALIMQVGK